MIHGYMISSPDKDEVAARLNAAGCEKIHQESAKSARTTRLRTIDGLKAGDILIVTTLRQFANSTRDLLDGIKAVVDKKAAFRALAEPWADTGARGVKPMTILNGIVEFERDVRRANTEAGQARAVARGVKLGRKPKLTPKLQQIVRRRRKRGETLAEIAQSYNVSHSTISRLSS